MTRLFQSAIGVLAVTVIVVGLSWSSLYGVSIRRDLHRIANQVRKSAISLQQKEQLLDRIDLIRERVRHGRQPSPMSWWEVSDAINDMLDGGIRDDEPRLIEREFDRIVNEIDEKELDGFSRKQERQPQAQSA